MDKFVAGKVESERNTSAIEVVREALRLLEERDRAQNAEFAAFDRELGARLSALDCGESVNPDDVRQRMERKSLGVMRAELLAKVD